MVTIQVYQYTSTYIQFQYAIKVICRHILVHSWTFLHCTLSVVLCTTLSLAQYENFYSVQQCTKLFSWQSTAQTLCALFRVGQGGVRRKRPLSLLHCHLTLLWVTHPIYNGRPSTRRTKRQPQDFPWFSDDFAIIFSSASPLRDSQYKPGDH